MVGIIHPCKIYGAMAAARPILYFGPRPSHITDLLDVHGFGRHVAHGDVEGAVRAIDELRQLDRADLAVMGRTAQGVLRRSLSQHALCTRFCDRLEQAIYGRGSAAAEECRPTSETNVTGTAALSSPTAA
jgi:colanic acid biosynthesis glycosyl transferase WcaI